jgi:hypothetical protein
MKMLGCLFLHFCFAGMAFAGSFEAVTNGFAKSKNDPAQILVSVINVDTAEKLFKKFASDKSIPFRYPVEDCEARTTAMARIAETDGLHLARLYLEGEMVAKTKTANYPVVYWRRHIVPVAFVMTTAGKTQPMAFDPSLFDHPVAVAELKLRILTALPNEEAPFISDEYYGSRFQYNSNTLEPSRSAWSPQSLKESAATLKKDLPWQEKTTQDLPPRYQEAPSTTTERGPAGIKNSARSFRRPRLQKLNN